MNIYINICNTSKIFSFIIFKKNVYVYSIELIIILNIIAQLSSQLAIKDSI